jgi:2-polyprenyl-6-methoxyphenol hydroxylase-like FAD-dependent oxidoreductase
MKAIVVGAGPAGAVVALLLARSGVEVTLFERETSFGRAFRGEGLMPAGVDALLQIGLGDLLTSVPTRLVEAWSIWIDGREAFVVPEPIDELGDRAMRVVAQPALLEGIVRQAKGYPAFRYEPGTRVRDLLRADGRVVGVLLEAAGETREQRADLVIGCDGRGSPTRHLAGLRLQLLPEQYDVLWCKLPAPPWLRARCVMFIMVAAHQDPVVCYTSCDGRLQYGLIQPKGSLGPPREHDWLEAAVQAVPAWLAGHLRAHRSQVDGPQRLNVLVGRCQEWTVPGLLLLGDAAHPMSPVRAQGINLALRDAIVAANHLVPALRSGDRAAVDTATRAVQAEREPEITRVQTLQRVEAAGQAEARAATWRFTLAKHLSPRLGRYRWAQQAWLRRQRELRFGVTDVKLRLPV